MGAFFHITVGACQECPLSFWHLFFGNIMHETLLSHHFHSLVEGQFGTYTLKITLTGQHAVTENCRILHQ